MVMRLPAARGPFGQFVLPDGSIIYPSGNDFYCDEVLVRAPNPGAFMLWHRTGTMENADGRKIPTGEFVMDKSGPRYFRSAIEALLHLEEIIPQ